MFSFLSFFEGVCVYERWFFASLGVHETGIKKTRLALACLKRGEYSYFEKGCRTKCARDNPER